jgi:ubiquinone/menaquinone biosynthesis C-methylase UbiE
VYDETKAEEYWTKRVSDVDQLAAVLSRGLPAYVNQAYSRWETATVLGSLTSWEGSRVLDLGCGVGRMTVPLVAAGAKVTAFDNSQKMLDLCAENLERAGLGGRANLQKGSARELPFEAGSTDVICCLGVLEHLPADVRQVALEEMTRVTAADGLILLVVNNSESTFLRREELYRMEHQQNSGYHVSLVGLSPTKGLLEERGFTVETIASNTFQSLAKHLIKGFLPINGSEATLTSIFATCAELDLEFRSKGDLDPSFADQYVIRARRRTT